MATSVSVDSFKSRMTIKKGFLYLVRYAFRNMQLETEYKYHGSALLKYVIKEVLKFN